MSDTFLGGDLTFSMSFLDWICFLIGREEAACVAIEI